MDLKIIKIAKNKFLAINVKVRKVREIMIQIKKINN